MMKNLLISLFIIQCCCITISFEIYPYPLQLSIPLKGNNVYPFYVKYQEKDIFLLQNGPYEMFNNTNGVIELKSESNYFNDYFVSNIIDNYYILISGSTEIYIFTYIQSTVKFKKVIGATSTETTVNIEEIGSNAKIDSQLISSTNLLVSYFMTKGYAEVYTFNPTTGKTLTHTLIPDEISSDGYFSCRLFSPVDTIYCFYAKSTSVLYYIHYKAPSYDAETMLYHSTSNDNAQFLTVKVESVGDNLGIGMAFEFNAKTYWLFSVSVQENSTSLTKMEKAVSSCHDIFSMNILKLRDNIILVSSFDGIQTRCRLYNIELEFIGRENYDICGYKEFRVNLSNNNQILNFVYVKDNTNYLYYIKHELINCKDISLIFSTNDYLDVSIYQFINSSQYENINPNSGIYFEELNQPEICNIIELDDNGNAIGVITYSNTSYIYNNIRIYPLLFGLNFFSFKVYFKINEMFFLPSSSCSITISNNCYETCSQCTLVGNENNHQCTKCQSNFYFVEGTNNCYASPPEGYYLDIESSTIKACDEHCITCNSDKCLTCDSGYTFLKTYTQNENDLKCILFCDSLWYYDSNENDIVCIKGETQCPNEYHCLNKKTKECSQGSSNCNSIIPEDSTIEEIEEYIDNNIQEYYSNQEIIQINNTTRLIVYDSKTNNTEVYPDENVIEIEFGDLFDMLRRARSIPDDEPIVISQVESSENRSISVPQITFYTKDGEKIDTTDYQNETILIKTPLNEVYKSAFDTETLNQLFQNGVNLFDMNDKFFNDKCSDYTSINNRDITITDRRILYYQTNSFCISGCDFLGFEETKEVSICKCTLNKLGTHEIIKQGGSITIFEGTVNENNYGVLKCYKKVFDGKILSKNVGSYFLLCFISLQIINFILYMFKNNYIFSSFLRPVSKQSNDMESSTKGNILKTESITQIIPKEKLSLNYPNNSVKKNLVKNTEKGSNNTKPFPKKNCTRNSLIGPSANITKVNMNLIRYDFYSSFHYDNRPFSTLFLLRLKQFNHFFILCFSKGYTRIIFCSISSVLFFYECLFFFNTLFFSDKYISQIYFFGYSVGYHLPKSIYSSILSMILCFILKILIIDYPDEEELEKVVKRFKDYTYKYNLIKKMKRFNLLLFIIAIAISLFYWYYLSAFCAVYRNTQWIVIYDTLLSILISFISIILISLFCATLRVLSLKCQSQSLFYFVKFIEIH